MYDPTIGRWLSEDPAGLLVDANPYRYVGNSPTNWIDPSGLYPDGMSMQQEIAFMNQYEFNHHTKPGSFQANYEYYVNPFIDHDASDWVDSTLQGGTVIGQGMAIIGWGGLGFVELWTGATMSVVLSEGHVVYGITAGGETTFMHFATGIGVTGYPTGFAAADMAAGYSLTGIPILCPEAAAASAAGGSCAGACWYSFLSGWGQ